MKRIEIKSKVIGGKLKRNLPLITQAIKSFEGKEITLVIKRATKQRSNNQNAYYWGVIIPVSQQAVLDQWGEVWNKDKTHEFFKSKFCIDEKVNKETGELVNIPKSTTELTTTEMEEYHIQIRQFINEWFNCEIPLPNENLQMFK